MTKKVLIVLTSADRIPKLDRPTGWYLPELAHPYLVLAPEAEIAVASPKGGAAPLDPSSVDAYKSDEASARFLRDHRSVWEATTPLAEYVGRAGDFDAVFYPGGHGPMLDLAADADSVRLVEEFYAAGKPVAAVCHGPIALRDARSSRSSEGGEPILRGRRVTGFSNAEEEQVQLSAAMPFLLEDELKRVGARYEAAPEPWGEKVVVDGQIITGQNPASAKGVGEAILKAIGA
ncbi:uncharacterized protein UV8b_04280 [Ustilaginoidea virens]|uniref:D-lactate dehydratase n=1 Tax=Ustilaginoidea virens TaxID=1159556 RepID=A0A1B5KUA3_USTVR|nr:uncharacterized protein UV8b_04280 [Ustilaginoidea virens]QUC20039.1 hypothetical protein UV8b_04280 [Ustilaginoidea virens]GAO14487.1 hypothetical protein UVI_02031990 [Ustilaginoidea virens]